MDSLASTAFFSQVYDDRVKNSREWITSICSSLDIQTYHLNRSAANTPGNEANRLIEKADFLIAFCTRKVATNEPDKFLTSPTILEEIATARARSKPILCFFEKGVEVTGFVPSSATYSFLDDAESLTNQDMASIIRSIHETKLQTLSRSQEVDSHTGSKNFVIPDLNILVQLKNSPAGLYWEYTLERTIQFQENHSLPFLSAAYCMEHREGCEEPPIWKIEVERELTSNHTVSHEVKNGFGSVEVRTKLSPDPAKGEKVFFRERYRSPHLATIFKPKSQDLLGKQLNNFDAYDGMAIINRIENLSIRYVFPRGYRVRDVEPIVSTFSNSLDFPHQQEITRLKEVGAIRIEEFDRATTINLSVERPLYQYFYGVSWNAPTLEELPNAVAQRAPAFED